MRRWLVASIALAALAVTGIVVTGIVVTGTQADATVAAPAAPEVTAAPRVAVAVATTTSSTTTTPPPPPAVAAAPATRGTTVQVAATLPPPLPALSGSGRRAVFSIRQQRVWVIEADGRMVRTFRVSARYDMPRTGTFRVWSRSQLAHSTERGVTMRYMIRFTVGPHGGNIGFHEIPRRYGVPMQTVAQLGQPLSEGCLREATVDAQFMWFWAYVGTTVVVVP